MSVFVENRKILYVDDEQELLNSFESLLRKENYKITTLQNSEKIIEVLEKQGPFALVLSDQRMPHYDGVFVLEKTKEKFPDAIRVLITGYSDQTDTIRAINVGEISSYISKPWDDDELKKKIKDWIVQFNLQKHNKFLLNQLDEENKKLNDLLEGTVVQTVRILGDIANHVSPQIAGMSERVKALGLACLKSFPNLTAQEVWEISRALDLFNLGIALLPSSIQNLIEKHGLSVIDRSTTAHDHHLLAAGLLKNIPRFENVARIIELQARNFNGSGVPLEDFTKGEDIPIGARMLHIFVDLVKASSGSMRGSEILQQMESMPQKYDVKIIGQILGNQPIIRDESIDKKVLVQDLAAGMILLEDVRSINGQLLMKSGLTLSETFLNI